MGQEAPAISGVEPPHPTGPQHEFPAHRGPVFAAPGAARVHELGRWSMNFHTWQLCRIALCLLLLPISVIADTLEGKVVGIADGDTLTLLAHNMQYRVRLAEIDAPERGQPHGNSARQALSDKVFRKTVQVEVIDRDRYGRLVGRIQLDGRDINREMVSEGHAWVYRRYLRDTTLLDDENAARTAGHGLWGLQADQVTPPWEWRRRR